MRKRKKKKIIIAISVVSSILVLILAVCIFKLTASYFHSEERSLFMNNNVFSFNCPENYDYIHLELSSNEENPIRYNIINPAGEVVKSDELIKNSEFFCDSQKGMWKVSFELNKEIKVNYKLWEGNLKFIDPLEE